MQIRLRPKRYRLDSDRSTNEIVGYLASVTGLTYPEIVRAAVREFAARRLMPNWKEVMKVEGKMFQAKGNDRPRIAGGTPHRASKAKVQGGTKGGTAAKTND